MSLAPYIFRPLRMLENQMRLMDEIFHHPSWHRFPRIDFENDVSTREAVIQNKEKFQVKLDVQDFKPEEITVKTLDSNFIQIEAKHEEKHDEDTGTGFISRQLVRRFVLPKGHDLKNITSSLSSDGVLTITAPRNVAAIEEKSIPVVHEDESSKK